MMEKSKEKNGGIVEFPKEDMSSVKKLEQTNLDGHTGTCQNGRLSIGEYFSKKKEENYCILSYIQQDKLTGYVVLRECDKKEKSVCIERFFISDKKERKRDTKEFINGICKYCAEQGMRFARVEIDLNKWENLRFWFQLGFDNIVNMPFNTSFSKESFASIEIEKELYQ